MKKQVLLFGMITALFLYLLVLVSPVPAVAESQTWKVRPGDNLEIIAATLEIPKEEIKKQNPGVSESSLQIGQKLKLPLRSHLESKLLEEELSKKDAAKKEELRKRDAAIARLEGANRALGKQINIAESQLAWQPLWFWGFWIFFAILAFIVAGACWIFRQTHPRVLESPDRSVTELRASQIRARPSFAADEESPSSLVDEWPPSPGRFRSDLRGQARQLSLAGQQRLGSRGGLVLVQKPDS
jgi:LysM repeat protein